MKFIVTKNQSAFIKVWRMHILFEMSTFEMNTFEGRFSIIIFLSLSFNCLIHDFFAKLHITLYKMKIGKENDEKIQSCLNKIFLPKIVHISL